MKSRILPAAFAAAALATGLAACGSSDDNNSSTSGAPARPAASGSTVNATLNGAGSTFAAPIYQQVGSDLKGKGLTVNYQGVGSGAGVSQFAAGTVDFAGSDPALADDDKATIKKGDAVQIPFALGAITASYKLSGVKSGLKLDGETLADIYLGKVKTWNDPEIAAQNSGASLPSTKITVVHRSDSSGTTKGFTQFLANYSPAWKSRPGCRQGHQVADRHRRQGQRRRRRRGQADRRRDRLRRAGLRAAERLHVRRRQEQVGQVHRPDAGVDLGRR